MITNTQKYLVVLVLLVTMLLLVNLLFGNKKLSTENNFGVENVQKFNQKIDSDLNDFREYPGLLKLDISNDSEYRLIYRESSLSKDFFFINYYTNTLTDTLSISNYNLAPPEHRIINGKSQYFLVITTYGSTGTGLSESFDAWYVLNNGKTKEILKYPSFGYVAPGEKYNGYYYSELSVVDTLTDNNDLKLTLTKRVCDLNEITRKLDKCEHNTKYVFYKFDKELELFIFDKNRSEIPEEKILTALPSRDNMPIEQAFDLNFY